MSDLFDEGDVAISKLDEEAKETNSLIAILIHKDGHTQECAKKQILSGMHCDCNRPNRKENHDVQAV